MDLTPLPGAGGTGAGTYGLRAGSTVGTVLLPSLRLLIRPKVGLPNLFFLLGFGPGTVRWDAEQFPYERDPDLFKAVAWVFEAEVRRAAAQGMVRGYSARSETLTTLKGRVDVAGQIRARQGRPFPLECRFEEYTEDVELNRVLKAAHRRLLQTPGLDAGLARRLRHAYRAFDGVASVEYAAGSVPETRFTRLDRHWEPAGCLARLVLQQRGIRDRAGVVVGASFTVDMNALFERFVEATVREEARRAGWRLVPQAKRHLAPEVPIFPDLVLRRSTKDFAVADAKYKELGPGGAPHADLYQMLAYCVSLGLPRGMLIYASERPPEEHTVERAGVTLEVAGVDMGATPREIEAGARRLARSLVQNARDASSGAATSKKAG